MSLILKGENLTKNYPAFNLKDINLEINQGEITGVVGENGNGKTTLLRILAGELSLDAGQLQYNFGNNDWYKLKQDIAYIPQRIPRWYGFLKDNLYFKNSIRGLTGKENIDYTDELIEKLGLTEFTNHKWTEISTGYRLRFQLAKVLLGRPKLIILDEPLANLDINAEQKLLGDLKMLAKEENVGIIFSSQQLHEVEKVADNLIFLSKGKALYSGKRKEFSTERNENIFELYGGCELVELETLLQNEAINTIQDTGGAFTLTASTNMTSIKLMQLLVTHNIELEYFRNISTSTRKLFS